MHGTSKFKEWIPDAKGYVREHTHDRQPAASLKTDLLLHYAMERRGVAPEMGKVCSYKVHHKVFAKLMKKYHATPPPGYEKVTLEQV